MAKFKYAATDIHGKRVRGVTDAASERGAMALLVDQELDVQQLKEKKSVLQFEITKKKLKQADLMHFCRQLAAFVRAGIPLVEALGVIEEEADDKTLREVLQTVQESLIAGDTFSAALEPFHSMFPQFFIDMLRAAELTGRLDDVLDEMSGYIRRDMEARAKIKSAITYPIIIAFASIATVVVLAVFVLPRFKTFFQSFNATLPLPTRMLISTTNFFGHRWFVIIGVLVLISMLLMALSRTERGRSIKDRILLKLPVLGEVIRYSIVERFCRLLSTMMIAGVPLPEAMAVLGQGTRNIVFQEGLGQVRDAMLRGEGIARPMSETQLFPSAVVQMIRVGENTGTLDKQLEVGSDYYGQELDYKIARLTALFEPAVILFMGVCVGFVALALISAMYGIYKQVQV
jgi:type IV pilus assembly protein PilC